MTPTDRPKGKWRVHVEEPAGSGYFALLDTLWADTEVEALAAAYERYPTAGKLAVTVRPLLTDAPADIDWQSWLSGAAGARPSTGLASAGERTNGAPANPSDCRRRPFQR